MSDHVYVMRLILPVLKMDGVHESGEDMKRMIRLILGLILILMLLVALSIAVPNAFGTKTMVVQSGSLEPAMPAGSLVFVVPAAKKDIQVGDVISYSINERITVLTYRVIAVDEQGRFGVKDEMNPAVNVHPVPYDNVLGVVRFSVPFAGYVMDYIKTQHGLIVDLRYDYHVPSSTSVG